MPDYVIFRHGKSGEQAAQTTGVFRCTAENEAAAVELARELIPLDYGQWLTATHSQRVKRSALLEAEFFTAFKLAHAND